MGCHNPRISDAVVFDRETLRLLVLAAYDRMIGLELDQLSADGCITEALRRRVRRQEPVDRAKRGLKRSQLTDGRGIPLVTDPAPASTRDHTLLPATLDRFADLEAVLGPLPEHPGLSLDAGYDYSMVHLDLKARGSLARSPSAARRPPSRPADGGWWSARTPG